jgi:hypothetical protein
MANTKYEYDYFIKKNLMYVTWLKVRTKWNQPEAKQ